MTELEINNYIAHHEYLKRIKEDTIITTYEEYEIIKDSKKINIDNKNVSIEVLKRILNNDEYYEYAKKFFDNEINFFRIKYFFNGDTCGNVSYNKITIIKGFEYLIKNNLLILNDIEKARYYYLLSKVSFSIFLKQNEEHYFKISIDGIDYSILVKDMISLMELSDIEFDNLYENDNIKTIKDIPKLHYLYATCFYFYKNNIINNYLVKDIVIKRFKELETMQKIDFESINRIFSTNDSKYNKITLNLSLQETILNGLPYDLSPIEKAVYIYIKMCKILTYDPEYYVFNQEGKGAKKHKNINYIGSINPKNNKVVCFEFNLIFSKFLSLLGINFQNYYKGMNEDTYGKGHVSLVFRYGKYLISADSVTSVLHGDLIQAKLNQPLVGLVSLNRNEKTKKDFKEIVSSMYKLIVQQELNSSKKNRNRQVEHIEDFNEIIMQYAKMINNLKNVNINERLLILIKKANSNKLMGVDNLSYVLQLRRILFNQNEMDNNIALTIIRNNLPIDTIKIADALAIFTINIDGFNNSDENYYYCYYPNKELVPITKEDLQNKFKWKEFEYIQKHDPLIPGLNERIKTVRKIKTYK